MREFGSSPPAHPQAKLKDRRDPDVYARSPGLRVIVHQRRESRRPERRNFKAARYPLVRGWTPTSSRDVPWWSHHGWSSRARHAVGGYHPSPRLRGRRRCRVEVKTPNPKPYRTSTDSREHLRFLSQRQGTGWSVLNCLLIILWKAAGNVPPAAGGEHAGGYAHDTVGRIRSL